MLQVFPLAFLAVFSTFGKRSIFSHDFIHLPTGGIFFVFFLDAQSASYDQFSLTGRIEDLPLFSETPDRWVTGR